MNYLEDRPNPLHAGAILAVIIALKIALVAALIYSLRTTTAPVIMP